MRTGFYCKLAWTNIKKNYRFFLPRILSEAGLLACFYISLTLWMDDRLRHVKGGYILPTFMLMGTAVLALLSLVLMLYINSFVMKQRTREFGLYNVLGMEKRHIGKVIMRETLICSFLALLMGLGLGVLFYKLCSLLICRLLHAQLILGFYYISPKSMIPSAVFFLLLDLITILVNKIRIAVMKPIELLRSMNAGEKEPKVRWLALVLGLITLGAGYYLALTIDNPVEAMSMFFIAVILVMAGTYLLLIAGSIFILKSLKNNKRYYYQKNHMPAVSGLLYRMKQNAVGLASIAILATGVLLMISTTVSLYSGYAEILKHNYPQDLYLDGEAINEDGEKEVIPGEQLIEIVSAAAEKNGVKVRETSQSRYLDVVFFVEDNSLQGNETSKNYWDVSNMKDLSKLGYFAFITEEEYFLQTGESLELNSDEIAVCEKSKNGGTKIDYSKPIKILGTAYTVKDKLTDVQAGSIDMASVLASYAVVVKDEDVLDGIYAAQKESYGDGASEYTESIAVTFDDRNLSEETASRMNRDIENGITAYAGSAVSYDLDTYWDAKENLLGMYGTLLFLGILLGAVCLFATTLIIYYKQISEGYEDRTRFQIMEKIGMSQQEVKKTINSQVLMVFLMPLIVAGIHMTVAFPLLTKILRLLALYSFNRFLICSLITFAVFTLVYVLIYKATSRTYYTIVH